MIDPNQDPENDADQLRTQWTEQDVERLLEGFFQEELPLEIRELADDGVRDPLRAAAEVEARPGMRWVVSAIATAALLVALAWFIRNPDGQQNPLQVETPPTIPQRERNPAVAQASALPLLSLTVDRFATEVGLVEQRTALKWETVSVYQPENGVEVAWSIPEVNIELYGVK